jgi:hypothetical protein
MTLQLDGFSGFPNVAAHYNPMRKRPSFKKLLSYGKEVNDRFFAKSAKATIDSADSRCCRDG